MARSLDGSQRPPRRIGGTQSPTPCGGPTAMALPRGRTCERALARPCVGPRATTVARAPDGVPRLTGSVRSWSGNLANKPMEPTGSSADCGVTGHAHGRRSQQGRRSCAGGWRLMLQQGRKLFARRDLAVYTGGENEASMFSEGRRQWVHSKKFVIYYPK